MPLELTANAVDAQGAYQRAQRTRVLRVLFFFFGFPALIYQLTWQRALFLILGVNIESVTIVVTAFMLGPGRRWPPLAASQPRPALRRDRVQHHLVFPIQCFEPAVCRVS
jgi:hypothetical protein